MGKTAVDISRLTVNEQLELLDELWETLGREPGPFALSEAQTQDLDRRLDELEREGPVGMSWEEAVERIRSDAQ
jgi:putative addiction module component (TIGR02574 family)